MNKLDYLNIIDGNVRDQAQNFVKAAVISAVAFASGDTTFTVNTVTGFYANDDIYLSDTVITYFGKVKSVDITNKKIVIAHDLQTIATGTVIKKNDALQYLSNALLTYSKFRPLIEGQAYTVVNSNLLALPDNWQQGFSELINVQYPYLANVVTLLDERLYSIVIDSAGNYKIVFGYPSMANLYGMASASAYLLNGNALLTFTAVHKFKEDLSCTVPDTDAYAVCDIASAYYNLGLANRYAQSVNPTIQADAVNYDQKPNQYIALYNQYMNKAAMWLNLDVDLLKKGIAQDEAISSNQEMDLEPTDDDVLIRINPYNYYQNF